MKSTTKAYIALIVLFALIGISYFYDIRPLLVITSVGAGLIIGMLVSIRITSAFLKGDIPQDIVEKTMKALQSGKTPQELLAELLEPKEKEPETLNTSENREK